jgi:hypothetical protein
MNVVPLLLTLLIAAPGTSLTDLFRLGVEQRSNAVEARKQFREAAKRSDEAWRTGPHSVELAILRSRSHFLAGNLPNALLAIHEVLADSPTDYQLHRELAALRETIRYPEPPDARLSVRPISPSRFWQLLSPWELYGLASVGAALAMVGLVGTFTTRPNWSRQAILVGLIVFFVSTALSCRIGLLTNEPVVILTRDTTLRTGNGESYPSRLVEVLPRGAELRVLTRRGGWVQVELPGGAAGWIPETNGAAVGIK